MPVFVVDVYNKGPESMGLLVAVMGVGSLVGSLFIAAIRLMEKRYAANIWKFRFCLGITIAGYPTALFRSRGDHDPVGIGDAARRTINQSLVMEKTDGPYQGRVMSVFMMNFGLMPLGVLPAGILVDILGGQAVIGALGVALLIFTLVILVTQKGLRIAN